MPDADPTLPRPRKIGRLLLFVLLLVALIFALRWIKNSGLLTRTLEWIRNLGPWAPVMFIFIYVAAAISFVPASILTLGSGILFGMLWGSVYVIIAGTIAANLAFLLGRHFARNWIAHKLEGNARFKVLDEAVARDGWKIVALVRLAPVFPFSVSSYGFGLTRVPLWHYFLASFAMIPGTLMYVYFGVVVGDLAGIQRGVSTPLWMKCAIAVVTFVVIFYVTNFARRALTRKTS